MRRSARFCVDAVYHDLLDEMAERGGVRVRILADIIAGASAGGINGIFLGHAMSTGQSLDPLTDLWLEAADIEFAERAGGRADLALFQDVGAAHRLDAAGRSGEKVAALDEDTREEVRSKLGHLIRSRWFEPPFSADDYYRASDRGVRSHGAGPGGQEAAAAGQPLDLFVNRHRLYRTAPAFAAAFAG